MNRTTLERWIDGDTSYADALQEGFTLSWPAEIGVWCSACNGSGGVCGYISSNPTCFCSDGSATDGSCDKGSHTKGIIIGVSVGVVGLVMAIFLGLFLYRRKKRNQPVLLSRRASSEPISSKKDPELGNEHYGTQVFEYEELQEATDGFNASNEVGDGGFGTVYKGKLRDGRTVAIKRLYENNLRRVEQFMTEVHILSSLRHHNLVSLYGCTSRHSRELLLVYEFVPNGTVADHLHGPRAGEEGLSWPVRMSIAIETALALTYLHAVTPPIIHRDVKTNNILLDSGFRVKVADFGLSRLFPLNVTHVSTVPQGTPGYVDPEYHRCYQLTDKSDVYSFGVVLVELIASKPAVDITRPRHEINLAKMAINKIQNEELDQLVDPRLWRQSNSEVIWMIRQVAEVAFGCLQEERDMRPTMKEVLEALRGIEGKGSNRKKGAEADDATAKDDDCSLLRERPPHSPDTVTAQWESRLTTPKASV
ncbi:serine threonine-protein kinase [Musa troglodytarum]|uniref:Serine threonine-protein kinase n=3 Tax=Musa troglodytarum TaxID=320322 RepID=A0A9E7KAY9_9LILI|nr:serine threonine-protein kinase [Musa troglodytarum]